MLPPPLILGKPGDWYLALPTEVTATTYSDYPPLTFIDLFCGAGGFSLGLLRAGFKCLAAVDADQSAVETYRKNLLFHSTPSPVPTVLTADLRHLSPEDLASRIGTKHVDVLVGGPPCQGFSSARKADGGNHGEHLKLDPRRHLFEDFLRFVDFFRPRVFVMENVMGMRSAAGGKYFTEIQKTARHIGVNARGLRYRVHSQIEDARLLGVPQKRRRQLIVGVRLDVSLYMPQPTPPAPSATPNLTLGEAIGDLPPLRSASGKLVRPYSLPRRRRHMAKYGHPASIFLEDVLEVSLSKKLTAHVARYHSPRDLRDFKRLREGETSATAARTRGVEFEFPYSRESFLDRYTRQSRSAPCSTIVAHLAKDGLMFIHPTQNRSITPREAARIQTFPDWFILPKALSPAFRLVGNAVPPLVAEAVGLHIRRLLHPFSRPRQVRMSRRMRYSTLLKVSLLPPTSLRLLPKLELLKVWRATLETFPHLHPRNAADLGTTVEKMPEPDRTVAVAAGLSGDYYAQTGWPAELSSLAGEVLRRHAKGAISDAELYLQVGSSPAAVQASGDNRRGSADRGS